MLWKLRLRLLPVALAALAALVIAGLLTSLVILLTIAPFVIVIIPQLFIWPEFAFRKKLIRADFQLCPRCGYDLRQAQSPCPECGRPFEPGNLRSDWSSLFWFAGPIHDREIERLARPGKPP